MRSVSFALRARYIGIALLLPLAACATPKAGSFEVAEADRWEGRNRKIYNFNKRLDARVLKPTANVYRTVVPKSARTGITNIYSNYGEPANIMNALLQGKIKQAFRSLDRLIINTTLGIGGIADNATELGRPQEPEDFGQTFATWGIESGPYVVLPVFGPSTLRDSFGLAFDIVIDPADFARNAAFSPSIPWRIGQLATRIINFRARATEMGADTLLSESLDEYALLKSVYLQNRRNAIYDGNPPLSAQELEDMDGAEPVEAAPAETGVTPDQPPPSPAAPAVPPPQTPAPVPEPPAPGQTPPP
jgi:phospholipid-binding lipoprotein MlaA